MVSVTVKFCGTVGGVVLTMTEVVAAFVPLPFVAVSVYVVVVIGLTTHEPAGVLVEKDPGSIVIEDVLAVFHEIVDAPAGATAEGSAENE